MWEARTKIDVYSSFESFLFTVAYNATISLFRKRVSEKKYLEHLKSLQQSEYVPDAANEIHFNELNEPVLQGKFAMGKRHLPFSGYSFI